MLELDNNLICDQKVLKKQDNTYEDKGKYLNQTLAINFASIKSRMQLTLVQSPQILMIEGGWHNRLLPLINGFVGTHLAPTASFHGKRFPLQQPVVLIYFIYTYGA